MNCSWDRSGMILYRSKYTRRSKKTPLPLPLALHVLHLYLCTVPYCGSTAPCPDTKTDRIVATPLRELSQALTCIAAMAHHQHDELTLQQTLNIPQLVVSLVLTALIARWVYTWLAGNGDGSASSAALNARGANAAAAARRRVDDRHIEQVQAVFPQFNRREIYWDLMRNGGRVEATTERILTGRGLDSVGHPEISPYQNRL